MTAPISHLDLPSKPGPVYHWIDTPKARCRAIATHGDQVCLERLKTTYSPDIRFRRAWIANSDLRRFWRATGETA